MMKKSRRPRIGRLIAVAGCIFLACNSLQSAADPALGTGAVGAESLVGGVSAVRTALAEAKAKKPEVASNQSTVKPVAAEVSRGGFPAEPPQGKNKLSVPKLSSRLELTAGSDRLIFSSDVLKQLSLFAEARYRLTDWLQIGATAAIRVQGNDIAKDIAGQLLIGPTINFATDQGLENAYFLSPKVGITLARTTVDGSVVSSGVYPTLSLSFGKRFAISQSVAYAPSLGVVAQKGAPPCFVAVPLAISIFF